MSPSELQGKCYFCSPWSVAPATTVAVVQGTIATDRIMYISHRHKQTRRKRTRTIAILNPYPSEGFVIISTMAQGIDERRLRNLKIDLCCKGCLWFLFNKNVAVSAFFKIFSFLFGLVCLCFFLYFTLLPFLSLWYLCFELKTSLITFWLFQIGIFF